MISGRIGSGPLNLKLWEVAAQAVKRREITFF